MPAPAAAAMKTAIAVLAAAVLLPIAPARAGSSYDPVGTGTTTLTLSTSFSRFLSRHHVSLEPLADAKRTGRKIAFPVSEGELDPGAGLASVVSEGKLMFVAGNHRVLFRSIAFKATRTPLFAKVGGSQLKVASAESLKATREGFGARFFATGLKLTAKVATRLNKKLRLGRELKPGTEIGSLAVSVTPQTVHLRPEGRINLAIAPPFFAKLSELFVSLNPVAPAELSPGPVLSFPVGHESTLAPDGSLGTIKTVGAVELLQLGNTQIFWREPWLEPGIRAIVAEADIEPAPPNPGRQPRSPLLSLALDGQVTPTPSARTIEIAGRSVSLTAGAAEALNSAFAAHQPTFVAGELLGTLSTFVTAE